MNRPGGAGGGSRFLYDSFDAAHARIEANERVAEQRWSALEYRLGQIETTLERLEKRIWLGVYGVAAFLLAQGAEAVLKAAMRG
jgi:predicted lysophospholipase L1 biosynthesis ABC-type transport system permease subunit